MVCRSGSQPLGPDGVSQTGELAIDREAVEWGPPQWAQLNYVAMPGCPGVRDDAVGGTGISEVSLMRPDKASCADCASRPQRRAE